MSTFGSNLAASIRNMRTKIADIETQMSALNHELEKVKSAKVNPYNEGLITRQLEKINEKQKKLGHARQEIEKEIKGAKGFFALA